MKMKLLAGLTAMFVSCSAAHSAVVTYDYSGFISSNNIVGGPSAGSKFSGSFSYDTDALLLSHSSDSSQTYDVFDGAVTNFSFFDGSNFFENVNGGISLVHSKLSTSESLFLYAQPSQTANISQVSFNLDDVTGTAFSGANLPVIDPSHFQNLSLTVYGTSMSPGNSYATLSIVPAVAAVPEIATWAMMILGMGAVGFAMRRQRTTTRVSYAA